MNQNHIQQFKENYKGSYKIAEGMIICTAKNAKDLKVKMQKAWSMITSAGVSMVVLKSSANSFTIRSY